NAEGWAELSIHLQVAPGPRGCPRCNLGPAISLLPLDIPVLARVAQTEDRRLLAVEWRLPEPGHPQLRPDSTCGAVTSAPTSEFLPFLIPAQRWEAASRSLVAEAAAGEREASAGAGPLASATERFLTVSGTRVESRSRLMFKPPASHIPTLRIVGKWLAAADF